MKIGDLVKWVDYTVENTFYVENKKEYIGLFLRYITPPTGFRDIVVLCNGKETEWFAFQCEVISESR